MGAAPSGTNPLMDKNFLNAFIDGVMKTHTTMANTEVVCGKPIVEKGYASRGEVAGMIGMTAGGMRGTMTISYSKDSIVQILDNMLGERHEELNDAVADGVGELTNMVYGSAKTTLNQMGYNFDMAIPTVVRGSFVISKYHKGTTLIIPFTLPQGFNFYVEMTIEA